MNLDLVILEGPEAGRRIPVASAPITLGRAPAAAMAFPDDGFISSVHLSVQEDAEGIRITDLRSTNGTFLNGERISSALAGIGDVIQIGTMTLQVAAAASPHAPAPVFSSPSAVPGKSPVSTLISPPALPRMDIPSPPSMNPSVVATTTIPQISVNASEHFRRKDSDKPTADALQTALRAKISSLPGQLYLMVNAAADETIPAMLAMGDIDLAKHSLWQEDGSSAPARWAPYLIPVTSDSALLSSILERGWGKNWISLFASDAQLRDLLAHFGKFLKVQMDQTGGIYFRFYDPKVLREFLPSGNPGEISMFFGPVKEWLLESDAKSTFLQATNAAEGFQLQTIRVSGNAAAY